MAVPKCARLPLDCGRKSSEFGLRNSVGEKDDGGLSWILKYFTNTSFIFSFMSSGLTGVLLHSVKLGTSTPGFTAPKSMLNTASPSGQSEPLFPRGLLNRQRRADRHLLFVVFKNRNALLKVSPNYACVRLRFRPLIAMLIICFQTIQ
jgi:hypothetical protein